MRRSKRLQKKELIENTSALDQYKYASDVDMSDSNNNKTRQAKREQDDEEDNEVSSATSCSEYGDGEEEEEQSASETGTNGDSSGTDSDSPASGDDDGDNDGNDTGDSDYEPNSKTKRSKPAARKKKGNKKQTRKQRGQKRKRNESSGSESHSPSDHDPAEAHSGSDEEYSPNGRGGGRKRRKTANTKPKGGASDDEDFTHLRRSTRNLGRQTKTYDDRALYGDIPGIDEDDDDADKKRRRNEYKNIAKKRKRGGIKKVSRASSKGASTSISTSSVSSSVSPNSGKLRKLKITHKAYKNQNGASSSSSSKRMSTDSNQSMVDDNASLSSQQTPYTYTTWLDDVVSDTEIQYFARGRMLPGKVCRVHYTVEVQNDAGLSTHEASDGGIRRCSENANANANAKTNATDDAKDIETMEVDSAASTTAATEANPDAGALDEDGGDDDLQLKRWLRTLKTDDYVEVRNEDTQQWERARVTFINRMYEIQYVMRKSYNDESIAEFDAKSHEPNAVLRTKMRPPNSVRIEQTPEVVSPSPSVKPTRKKKKRFNDSEEDDDDDDEDDDEDDEDEDEDDEDEDEDMLQSRATSTSPFEELECRVEEILYRMRLPASTKHWRTTFAHLTTTTTTTTTTTALETNTKMEADNDTQREEEDKENVGDTHNNDDEDEDEDVEKQEHRDSALQAKYLIKYLNRSYHHCEWLTRKELRALDADTKMVNFDKKFDEYDRRGRKIRNAIDQGKYTAIHFFNELYLQIDRVISYAEPGETFDTVTGAASSSNKQFRISTNTSMETMYLVKWRGMQYDAATWEMDSFLTDDAFDARYSGRAEIDAFFLRQTIPASKYLHPSPRSLNMHYFKNRPAKKLRVGDDETFKGGHTLRGKYQQDGVNWLINNWQYRMSCILADEMGLGKTVQTVTFVNFVFERYEVRGPFLIVAPLSTLGHWSREFRAWSDLNVVVYHGSAASRDRIVEEEFDWRWTDDSHNRARTHGELKKLNANNFKFHVLLTTPQIVNQDQRLLNGDKIKWNAIIVDEAHSLKSHKSLFYRTLLTFKNQYTHTVMLTGTPIQNNMEELWCLLHFMDAEKFADQTAFCEKFENLAESKDELKKLLEGRLLQRLKYLVETDLCRREEKIIWVELTLFQKRWYKALYQKSYEKLRACGAAKASLMNVAMQLRKCCNHPFLITDVEKTMSPLGTDDVTMNANLIKASGKLVLLDKLLPKLKREGHRVLIFSQMSHLLDILEDYLNFRHHLYERLDGSVTGIERQEAIDRFQKDDSIFCFLLTTRAGGVGINLMAADTVIIYDSDWNPMNDVQAIARCHRIGQTKQVNVYRLITRNCYEESMFKRADQKLALNKVVMGDMKDMQKSDINDMLKKGAIAMFLKDVQTDDDIKKFADANIDDILAKRTETVQHDAENADPDRAMFSEAVFVAHADDADVNVDDENFWEVLGVGKDDEEEADVYGSPFMRRRRTRLAVKARHAARYGGGDDADDDDAYEYALDAMDADGAEQFDEGTSLLGALSYLIYGQWPSIYRDLSYDEKVALGLRREHNDDNEQNNDDEEAVDAPLSAEQLRALRQASVETICKMANLMKPNIRNAKLGGADLKRLETMLNDKEFRNDCIECLSQQIYEQDLMALPGAQWKQEMASVWPKRSEKNRFVDVSQLNQRDNLCKMGCKRVLNDQVNPKTDRKFDTCCANCANAFGGKDFFHEAYCEKRHFADWRCHIRDEALKAYLNAHPLQKVSEGEDNGEEDSKMASADDATHATHSVEYDVQAPNRETLMSLIVEELKYHGTDKIVLAMRHQLINVKSLRDELKNKTHGDIVAILNKLERMFKFKILGSLHHGDVTKLDFSTKKATKAMPEWWSPHWDQCMVAGTLQYGWGAVPAQFVRDTYNFTPTYKGEKKVKKPTKKELDKMEKQQLAQSSVADLLTDRVENVSLQNSNNDVAEAPVMIVKKRQWIAEGKKQETILISICNHFRKEIRDKFKKVSTKIKSANKSREQRVLNPTSTSAGDSSVRGLSAEMNELLNPKPKKKKDKKDKKEKKAAKHKSKGKDKDKDKDKEKKNAFDVSNFEQMNSITNYFSTSSSSHNKHNGMHNKSGEPLKNAFEILGAAAKKSPKKKKKHKDKYEKTKLVVGFDENGTFKLPIKLTKTRMVTKLGEICTEDGYHAPSYIYPVGYTCCNALLPSLKRPGQTTTFTTVILKGEKGPLFEVTCSDDRDFKLSAKNPSKVWGQLKQMFLDVEQPGVDASATAAAADGQPDKTGDNESNASTPTKKKGASGHGVSGPQKIGLAHPDVKRIIECLPNALGCSKYKFRYRSDGDKALSPKKAFKKTLKIRKESSPKKKSPKKLEKERKQKAKEAEKGKEQKELEKVEDQKNTKTKAEAPMSNTASEAIVIEDSPNNAHVNDVIVVDLCDSETEQQSNPINVNDTHNHSNHHRKRKLSLENLNDEKPHKKRKIDI